MKAVWRFFLMLKEAGPLIGIIMENHGSTVSATALTPRFFYAWKS